MKRRLTTSLLGAFALSTGISRSGFAAGSSQDKGVRRIGWLSVARSDSDEALQARRLLYELMRQAGFDERANLIVERRYAEGDNTRLAALAEELVRLNVELIVAVTNDAIHATHQATHKIPIVMLGASLPVEVGFVASLAQPGGNVTGTAAVVPETAGRMLQVLKEAVPAAKRVAVLFNPKSLGAQRFGAACERMARTSGMQVDTYETSRPQDIAPTLKRIVAHRMEALFVIDDTVITPRLSDIASFALKHKLVSMGTSPQFAEAGGMLYCGPDAVSLIERTVIYAERILKGAKPADLAVEQPVKFELIVNLKTANALGRAVPQTMLTRATTLIE